MIESRYKIEYVVPGDDFKKTSPFKVLWALLLIPLIGLVVLSITYNFSIKDISRDSMVLLERAKVHVFNLGDASQLQSLKRKEVLVRKPVRNDSKVVNSALMAPDIVTEIESVADTVQAEKVALNFDKITINELTNAQKLQLKTIKEQIAKNSQLTSNLNKLSEQLVQEQIKNESLNSKFAAQEKDRLELEQELYKVLEKSERDTASIHEVATSAHKAVTIQEDDLELIDLDLPSVIPEFTGAAKENNTKEIIEKSETDKIIEAMATVTTSKTSKQTTTPIKTLSKVETVKDLPEDVIISTGQVTADEKKKDKQLSTDYIQDKVTEPALVMPTTVKTSIDLNEEKTIVVNKEIKAVEEEFEAIEKTIDKESVTLATKDVKSKPKEISSVDAIIAAMQGVKSDITDKTLSNNQKAEQKPAEKVNQ